MRRMTKKQQDTATETGAVYVIGASELNRMLAGRSVRAVGPIMDGMLIDYDVPCQYCGRRCVAVIGKEEDVTPSRTCKRCYTDRKPAAQPEPLPESKPERVDPNEEFAIMAEAMKANLGGMEEDEDAESAVDADPTRSDFSGEESPFRGVRTMRADGDGPE